MSKRPRAATKPPTSPNDVQQLVQPLDAGTQQRLRDTTARFVTILRMPSSGVASVLAELSSPAATINALRSHRVALDVDGTAGPKSLVALDDEAVEVAKLATKCAEQVIFQVVEALRQRRAQAETSSDLAEFFSLCSAQFSSEQLMTLKDCVAAFEEVVPLTSTLEIGLRTASDMKKILTGLLQVRSGEAQRRGLHRLAASVRGSDVEVAAELARQLPGLGPSSTIALWTVQSVYQSQLALHLHTQAGVHLHAGVLVHSLARREALKRVLVNLSTEEGFPPFLRSCRRSADAPLTWTSDVLLPPLDTLPFAPAELPVTAFGVPAHRAADLGRELADVYGRYVATYLWCPPRDAIISSLLNAWDSSRSVLALEVPAVKVPSDYAALLTRTIKEQALRSTTNRGGKAFALLLAKVREVPVLTTDEHPQPRQLEEIVPDFVAAIVVVQVDGV